MFIPEIELNTSNLCGANCIFCSRKHGIHNSPLMEQNVFDALIEQLQGVEVGQFQTSGNGECFINPRYLDYVKTLKRVFPETPRWLFNNFSMLNQERAEAIVEGDLFDRIHVRLDSLHPWIFEKASNLNHTLVMENIAFFLEHNERTPVTVLYADISRYYRYCQEMTGRRPARDLFSDEELEQVTDEFEDIKRVLSLISYRPDLLTFERINPCLWAEREGAKGEAPCPKREYAENCIWLLPNGDVTTCPYDDAQDAFICGNILQENITDIFNGERRREMLDNMGKLGAYPCSDPRLCYFEGTL